MCKEAARSAERTLTVSSMGSGTTQQSGEDYGRTKMGVERLQQRGETRRNKGMKREVSAKSLVFSKPVQQQDIRNAREA